MALLNMSLKQVPQQSPGKLQVTGVKVELQVILDHVKLSLKSANLSHLSPRRYLMVLRKSRQRFKMKSVRDGEEQNVEGGKYAPSRFSPRYSVTQSRCKTKKQHFINRVFMCNNRRKITLQIIVSSWQFFHYVVSSTDPSARERTPQQEQRPSVMIVDYVSPIFLPARLCNASLIQGTFTHELL